MEVLGIDIGGSGIKGAPVDIAAGRLLAERHRIPTPQPARPDDVAGVVAELVRHFAWTGPVGCTFPAVIKHGVALTAANVDRSWIGTHAESLFSEATGCRVRVVNDADAAGLAEVAFGAGRGQSGTVLMLTLGTGIGSALFLDGALVPNTEFGHIEIRGKIGEHRASDRVRKEKDYSWEKWAGRLEEYLQAVERLVYPDLLILGGGVSKKHGKFLPLLKLDTPAVPAELRNEAGIVGAAWVAGQCKQTVTG